MSIAPKPAGPKNWPPAFAAVVVGVLVFIVLPNPLRVPQNNPTASAEYAPVPGNPDDAENANFSQTGAADSAGIGVGGLGEGALPGSPPPPPPPQFKPRTHECVGNPPRQDEDPLSPPCVFFYDGDNGGSTWHGVTKDEILVAYYNDDGVEGDLTTAYKPSDESGLQADYYHYNHVRTVKALLRYFQSRYQTYGRRVKLVGYASGGGRGTAEAQRQGEALAIKHEIDPFAVAVLIENAQEFAPEIAYYKIPVFGWNEDVPKSVYDRVRPYLWSFMPDQQTESEWSASFICQKLKGHTARFSKDPTLRTKQRKFAIIWPEDSQRGPFLEQMQKLLRAEVRRQCNMVFDYAKSFIGNADASTMLTRMKNDDITTVVCYCIAQQNELNVPAFQNAATALEYFPEWYWDHASAMDRALWQREYGSASQSNGFGVSYLWRQPAFKDSYAYQAYLSQEPNTQPNLRWNFEIYHVFLNLFSGIQAAGPNLTPDSVERGMFTFRYTKPDNPLVPTGGYGTGGPSPYTFMETAMAWHWDPTGTPPGGKTGEGCIKVQYEGRRFYAGKGPEGWPDGDADMFNESDPCTEDERRRVS